MPTLIVDSSFLVAVVVHEEHSLFARERLEEFAAATMLAPALLAWEFANVLEKKVRQGKLSRSDCKSVLNWLDELPVVLVDPPSTGDLHRLIDLCERHGLTAYDAAYLDIAMLEQAELATLDAQLANAARAEGLTVHCPL